MYNNLETPAAETLITKDWDKDTHYFYDINVTYDTSYYLDNGIETEITFGEETYLAPNGNFDTAAEEDGFVCFNTEFGARVIITSHYLVNRSNWNLFHFNTQINNYPLQIVTHEMREEHRLEMEALEEKLLKEPRTLWKEPEDFPF